MPKTGQGLMTRGNCLVFVREPHSAFWPALDGLTVDLPPTQQASNHDSRDRRQHRTRQQAAFRGHPARAGDRDSRAQGAGLQVNKFESPERILQIFWDKLEDHTVAFRQGPLAEWRAIVGPSPRRREHFDLPSRRQRDAPTSLPSSATNWARIVQALRIRFWARHGALHLQDNALRPAGSPRAICVAGRAHPAHAAPTPLTPAARSPNRKWQHQTQRAPTRSPGLRQAHP
jgi:hypothetical protein